MPTSELSAATSLINGKINGSDGPVSVPDGTIAYLSWTSAAVKNCTMDGKAIASTGSNVATVPISLSHTYSFVCQKTSGTGTVSDSVTVNPVADPSAFTTPTPVTINGYADSAMEPSISRDGQFLFFNDSANNKQIYYASRVDDITFDFVGPVGGNVNSASTNQQTPSLDSSNNFYFTSNRSYNPFAGNFETVFGGTFNPATGTVNGVTTITGISRYGCWDKSGRPEYILRRSIYPSRLSDTDADEHGCRGKNEHDDVQQAR